jgi:anti-anti-sigma regulatory factor
MGLNDQPASVGSPLLEIELAESSEGLLARFVGVIVAETAPVVRSIEPMLINEARVVLDFCGVTGMDGVGLQAAVKLMDAVYTFGGKLVAEEVSGSLSGFPLTEPTYRHDHGIAETLGRLTVRS